MNLTDIATDPYANEMEASPSSWRQSCGGCHVGGGQLEYDRNMNPYGLNSPTGDRYTYIKARVENGQAVGGLIVDLASDDGIPFRNTELYGDNNAEIDCMLCHAADARPMVAWYMSMGCGQQNGVSGPKGNPDCSSSVDPRFDFTPGAIYDIYNRNMAITKGWLSIAATAGLGVKINPQTGQLAANTPSQIPGTAITGIPKAENCAQCHARLDNTVGLPGMYAMKAGYGNYATITMPGYGFDADEINSSGICTGGSAHDCKNDMMWFELGCKTGMGKRSQSTGNGLSDKWGMGICTICDGYNPWSMALWNVPNTICYNPALQGACQMYGMNRDGVPSEVGQPIPNKLPDTDVHYTANMKCATCHYALGSDKEDKKVTIPAKTYGGVSYSAEEIWAVDHQFAQGYSVIEKSKDNLDGTVTCAGCHITKEHPNAGSAPTPTHAGFPAIHLNKIDCRTCHIPQVYSSPGRLKYRDWTVGWFRGLNRNQLNWNFNMLTGSPDPMKNLHVWITTPEGTKIAPVQESNVPVWTEKLTVAGNQVYAPAKTRDINNAAAIVKGKINDGLLQGVSFTINRATVIPLFDGFTLADALAIDTKADIDAMVDELENSNGLGLMPHARLTQPKIRMFQFFFDVSHGIVPKQYALGGSMSGGCISCHSSSKPSDPNYSPKSVGFFDMDQELLKHPLSQLADYDCEDINGLCALFDQQAYGGNGDSVCDNSEKIACKTYVGGQLMPGLGMQMDGIDFIQMMAIKEGAPADCNPMMMLFDTSGSWMNACDNDSNPQNGLYYMLSRSEAKERFLTMLQQSKIGNVDRIYWPISVTKNPSNPSHQNSWDQAQVCYNPLTGQTSTCGDGGLILTKINANQLLGYQADKLAKLMNPNAIAGSVVRPKAKIKVTRTGQERGQEVEITDQSVCPTGDCSKELKVGSMTDNVCNATTPLTLNNGTANHTFTLAAGTYTGMFCAQMKVTDNTTGIVATHTVPIRIVKKNEKPTITIGEITVANGIPTIHFTTQDSDDAPSALQVRVVWQDRRTGIQNVTTVAGNAGSVTKPEAYPNVTKTYNVRLTVIDTKGGRNTATAVVNIIP
jgi:hypothetical protein